MNIHLIKLTNNSGNHPLHSCHFQCYNKLFTDVVITDNWLQRNIFLAAQSLATTSPVHRGALLSLAPAQPTHCSQCQCGFSTASSQLKLSISSVRLRSMSVVELVSNDRAPLSRSAYLRSAAVIYALALISRVTNITLPCNRLYFWRCSVSTCSVLLLREDQCFIQCFFYFICYCEGA